MFPLYDLNPHERTPIVTVALIIANTLALIWFNSLAPDAQLHATLTRGFIPARIAQLETGKPITIDLRRLTADEHLPDDLQLVQETQLNPIRSQIIFSLFSAMFLHGGWLHLLGNMWFLWIFGNNIEDRLGHLVYLCFYLVGGLAATACHYATAPNSTIPVIGASGAVAAILGAYAVTFPHAKVRTLIFLVVFVTTWDLPALAVLGFWFVGQLLEGHHAVQLGMDGGVAWWAHVGGFIFGAVLMPIISRFTSPPADPWQEMFDHQPA